MKKRAKIHRLPNENGIIWSDVGPYDNQLALVTKETEHLSGRPKHHLYITTDDEIKEGDQVFNSFNNTVYNIVDTTSREILSRPESIIIDDVNSCPDQYMKIIATTDPELNLPQPLKKFIEEYCKVGGIDKVDVEYEEIRTQTYGGKVFLMPKVTSNNEIIIHPIKDSWTLDELPDLLNRFCNDHSLHRGLQITDGMIREWLKKQ